MILPFNGPYNVTNKFGVQDTAYANYPNSRHPGTDWAMPEGTPLHAGISGTVAVYDRDPKVRVGRGKEVSVRSGNMEYNTCHMSKIEVQNGQSVKEGQLIGYSGNTGYSTGPHLHAEFLINGQYVDLEKQVMEKVMIPDENVWFARFAKLVAQVTGQSLTRDAFRKEYVGKDSFGKVAELSDSKAAQNHMNALVGAEHSAKQNGDIAEARFQQEKRVADLVGVTNPDDTDAIVAAVKELKNATTVASPDQVAGGKLLTALKEALKG